MPHETPLATALTKRLAIAHPLLLAPMDMVADANLDRGCERRRRPWPLGRRLRRRGLAHPETGPPGRRRALRSALASSPGACRSEPGLLDLRAGTRSCRRDAVLRRRPRRSWSGSSAGGRSSSARCRRSPWRRTRFAAGADILVAQGSEAGGHGGESRRHVDAGARDVDAALGRCARRGGRWNRRRAGNGGRADARRLGRADGHALLRNDRKRPRRLPPRSGGRRKAQGDDTARSIVFDITRQRTWPAPFTGRCCAMATWTDGWEMDSHRCNVPTKRPASTPPPQRRQLRRRGGHRR